MESHHKHCDTVYVKAENELNGGDEEKGKKLMAAFLWNMEVHFQREEQILFPAFEQKTGMTGGGPTQVMRTEHQQIRGVLKEMQASLEAGDYQQIFNQAETMLILIQQHNAKEENMLYPMSDQHLGRDAEKIAKAVQLFVL
ncbi:hemerythrin domain-containing protein [bacterium]|nr:hemerythrin domain-containing protein [bacterium]